NLLPQSSLQVSEYINDFAEKSTNLTAIGIVILFLTTIMTLTTIERAFNQIWRVTDRAGGIKSMLRYWTIVTMGPIVLGTAFIASSTVQSLSFLNRQIAGYGIDWSFWVQMVSIGITVAGFVGMYWFIPKARVPFKNAAIAGIIVAIVFELLKHIFGTVMTNFTSYEAIYGAFAALPIFLLWIYLSWNLILLGVEISYTLTIFETKEVYPRHPLLSLLDMLNVVYSHYLKGEAVSEQELRDVLGRKELPKWYTYINYLKDSNLITTTEHDEYVLKRDLSKMSLWDFYRTLPYPLPIKDELDEM
ncbi:YhjD/YihY/BrkB family envelope integrity protein, partial [Psychrobacter sp. T6-1]